jgi:hypothetical protein
LNIGFAAKASLDEAMASKTVNERVKIEFLTDCRIFLQAMTKKLLEKSPLRFKLVRNAHCLSPKCMATMTAADATKSFRTLLQPLLSSRRFTPNFCDEAALQYDKFVENVVQQNMENFLAFDKYNDRMDVFLSNYLCGHSAANYYKLYEVVKLIACLFTGQSQVERGFSVNKEILSDNMKEKSIVAQRQVYDAIQTIGGIKNVTFTHRLLSTVRSARAAYRLHLEKLRDEQVLAEKEHVSLKLIIFSSLSLLSSDYFISFQTKKGNMMKSKK